MVTFIHWLRDHKPLNCFILLAYFLAVVLPHKRFGTFLNKTVVGGLGIDNNTLEGRQTYNAIAISVAAFLLILLLYFFIKNTKDKIDKRTIWFYMALNIVLAILVIELLFVVNIEFIHYPQYALFAILSFPLIQNYHQTLIWSTLAGVMDEAYQYFYLSPKDTWYYDFNDIITNLIGVIFGLLILRSLGTKEHKWPTFYRSPAFIGVLTLLIIVIVLDATTFFSIYPNDDAQFQLLRKWPDGFWSRARPKIIYHVTLPLEGSLITIGLWVVYSKIGPRVTGH